jgi:outer membrane biosynthesis protein TonB
MRTLKSLAMVFGVCLFLLSMTVNADEWNKKTVFTFSGPVAVGKTQLEAGTYVFKLADTTDRHVVQIWNADETHVIATMIAIPDYRLTPTGDSVVKFSENGTDAGMIPVSGLPVKEWFYPGDNFGQEFKVYPQQEVAEVEQTTETTAEAAPAPEPAPEAEAAPAPEPEAAPAPEPQAEAPAQEAPATQEAAPATDQQSTTPEQLPQTASNVPLVGMIGMLALAVAASLRIFLKISA